MIDRLLEDIAQGTVHPVYLVTGDLVLAEPQAEKLAEALATRAGTKVDRHRRPARLTPLLEALRTYSLFGGARVVLAVDTALFTDRNAAADLIDEAEDGLPVAGADLNTAGRQAASRLLQALRVFGIDPRVGTTSEVFEALPDWALKGGRKIRKSKARGRTKKMVATLREGLEELLERARDADLVGFADGDLAEMGAVLEQGLPEGHVLVLAESVAASDHPVVTRLAKLGTVIELGQVTSERGQWHGLEPIFAQLATDTEVRIARDARDELARRTLKQQDGGFGGGFRAQSVKSGSTARLGAEYRKLASLVGRGGTIRRDDVLANVQDFGDEDVWAILDAVAAGNGGDAVSRLRRYLAVAADPMATRLSFFGLLAGFCRQLAVLPGLVSIHGVPKAERSYPRFKSRHASALQAALPGDLPNPLAGLHPYRLHRAYLAASNLDEEQAARLPWLVLETELRLKGEASDATAALTQLMTTLAGALSRKKESRQKKTRHGT
ncbi:MAG: hypothetical protein AAGD38_21130 [Acidobacteriota bacterium]